MITKEILEEDKVLYTIKGLEEDKEESFYFYQTHCPEPMCNCGQSMIHLVKQEHLLEKKHNDYAIIINVQEEKILSKNKDNVSNGTLPIEELGKKLTEGLTKEDWLLLKKRYAEDKFDLCEEADVKELEYEFEDQYFFDRDLMFPYDEAFPSSIFELEMEEDYYIVLDAYCKTLSCKCSDMMLSVIKVERDAEGNTTGKSKQIGAIRYDYKKKKKELERTEKEDREEVERVFNFLKEKQPNLDLMLEKRNLNCRVLFGQAQMKRMKKLATLSKKNIVGRNESCPCGSGKKYKKCCLKKK